MISIHNTDCIDLMATMEDKSIDLIVTDPPYSFNHVAGKGHFEDRNYFGELVPLSHGIGEKELGEFMRICKIPNMYLWGNWKQILFYISYFEHKNVNSNILCWHKSNPPPLCSNVWLNDTEYCLHVRGKGAKLYGGYADHKTYWTTSVNLTDKKKYGHPTIKPLEIISQMVKNSSLEGQTVFDPYLGSGTTAVACKMLNRNCIGCEIEEKYISLINNRLNAVNEGKWF